MNTQLPLLKKLAATIFTMVFFVLAARAQTITAGTVSGTISACQGTASAPQQFIVSGSGLTGDITATAPAGFELSLNVDGGYGNSVALPLSGDGVGNTVVYVRSTASATGNITGNIVVSTIGATDVNVAVAGIVNVLPTIKAPPKRISARGGRATKAIKFTGTANSVSWTNNMPGIGLAASGTGNIPSFKAVNTSGKTITATITATPLNQSFAYIANGSSIAVINTTTNLQVTTITVDDGADLLAVSPDGKMLYAYGSASGTLSIIFTNTNEVDETIGSIFGVVNIIVSPDGSKVYLGSSQGSQVTVIDADSEEVTATITLSNSYKASAISPDGNFLYITKNQSIVQVINTATNAVIADIPVSANPNGIAVSPDGSKLYVTDASSSDITVINTATNTASGTITGVTGASSISISPDGNTLYVASNVITAISTVKGNVIRTFPGGRNPIATSLNGDGSLIYVQGSTDNSVTVVNTATGTSVQTFSFSAVSQVQGSFVSPGGCSGNARSFSIVVLSGGSAGTTIDSVTINGPTITNAATVNFTVTFADPVTGLTADNFAVSTIGTGSPTVGTPTTTGDGTTWTVPVLTGNTDDVFALGLTSADNLSTDIDNDLPFYSDPFTFDQTRPTINISAPSVQDVVAITGTVSYTVTYDDANFDHGTLTASDVQMGKGSSLTGDISVSGSGKQYVVTISNVPQKQGFGWIDITGGAVDKAGNIAGFATSDRLSFSVLSNDATLDALSTSQRAVSPVFKPGITSYNTTVPVTAASTTIIADANENAATLQVSLNGEKYQPLPNGTVSTDLPLNVGANTINILSTAPDGITTKTYTLTITRQQSAALTAITYSPNLVKTKVPGSNYVDYTASVKNTVSQVTVAPLAQDPTAVIMVNGQQVLSGKESDPVDLVAGKNTINTVVTTLDGSTKTYSIVVTRAGNALLSALSYSPGLTVKKVVGTHDFDYTATVYKVSEISITPVAVEPTATVQINGEQIVKSGETSKPVTLKIGLNEIDMVVTSADGVTTKTYSISITRQANALLTALNFSPAIVKTKVDGNEYADYTATVSPSLATISVTAIAQDPTATLTINGQTVKSGETSAPITLVVGDNIINTIVTSQDGSISNTYRTTIKKDVNALLKSLTYSPALTTVKVPGKADFNYTAILKSSSIGVMPVAESPDATITVNGTGVKSGDQSDPIYLKIGENTITTVVTASDGKTTKTYSLVVTRLPNALLATITYSPLSIRKEKIDGPDYVNYFATVAQSLKIVTVTAVPQDPTSTLTVNGQAVKSGETSAPITLNPGPNYISTVVTAEDGTTTNTYTIRINQTDPRVSAMLYEQKEVPIINPEVVVHQNVSPNGDGNSDVLVIDGIAAHPDNKLQIMSRAGALVYEAKGYDNASKVFDGHASNGRLQQAGTYFYSLEYKDGNEVKKKTGYIVLKY